MRTCPTCRYKHPMIIIQIPIFIVKPHDSNAVLSCWLFSFSNFTMQRKQRSPPTGGRGLSEMKFLLKFMRLRFYSNIFAKDYLLSVQLFLCEFMKSVCFIFIHDLFELIGIVCFQISYLIGQPCVANSM